MRKALIVAAVVAATLIIPTSGQAQEASAKVPLSKFRFVLTFDHKETLVTGSRVRDASGHRHAGVVVTEAGGRLKVVKSIQKRAAAFPRRCHGCGRALIEIPDRKGLDPGGREFVFGVTLRVAPARARGGANLIQKGFFNEDGGQWKLQLHPGGIPGCVVFGASGRVKVNAAETVADGHWHRVTCTRTRTGVTLGVDGKRVASLAGPTGSILNDAPVRIGGKKVTPANKQFHGTIDSVSMRVLPRP